MVADFPLTPEVAGSNLTLDIFRRKGSKTVDPNDEPSKEVTTYNTDQLLILELTSY